MRLGPGLAPYLEIGHVGVQVQPVYAGDVETDMAFEDLVDVHDGPSHRATSDEGRLGSLPGRHRPSSPNRR